MEIPLRKDSIPKEECDTWLLLLLSGVESDAGYQRGWRLRLG